MSNSSHGFYIAIAYGLSAVLLALEVIALVRRCRKQEQQDMRHDMQQDDADASAPPFDDREEPYR